MKKIIYLFGTLSALLLVGCAKQNAEELQKNTDNKGITLTVTTEDGITKSLYNTTDGATKGQFTWSEGDQIGVHAWVKTNTSNNWPDPLTIDASDDGKTEGHFRDTNFDTDNNNYGTVAFYPWNGYATGSADENGTNVGDNGNTLYVHLKPSINYLNNSGNPQQLLPLVAPIKEGQSSGIKFKHIGAGIMVTLENVPTIANKVSLTISGQTITGWFAVPMTDINDASIAATSSNNDNTVTISFPATMEASRSPMTFVFPLPTVSFKAFTLRVYCDNYEIWSKSAETTTQDFSLGKGDILNMGSLSLQALSSKAIVYVGIVDHISDPQNASVHAWKNGESGIDYSLNNTGIKVDKFFQSEKDANHYWNDAQTYTIYAAIVPNTVTNYGIRYNNNWLGETSSITDKAYIYNYTGNHVVFE